MLLRDCKDKMECQQGRNELCGVLAGSVSLTGCSRGRKKLNKVRVGFGKLDEPRGGFAWLLETLLGVPGSR